MRMRKRHNLDSRVEKCAELLTREPEKLRGNWRGERSAQEERVGRKGARADPRRSGGEFDSEKIGRRNVLARLSFPERSVRRAIMGRLRQRVSFSFGLKSCD